MDAEKLHFREMFWDEWLMEENDGVRVTMHAPRPEDVVFVCDRAWEGCVSGYFQIFRDGPAYRLYYRGASNLRDTDGRLIGGSLGRFCYAESPDGIRFTRPELGIVPYNGSTKNNILFGKEMDNIFVFRDPNPACPPEERYKGLCGEYRQGLMLYASPDGVHFSETGRKVIEKGHFDSLNTCFWNQAAGRYELYYRSFHPTAQPDGGPERNVEGIVRDIHHAVSPDFVTWTEEGLIGYGPDAPDFQMYTNNVMLYPRAPHMYVGWPTRYIERRMDPAGIPALPDWDMRRGLIEEEGRGGTAMTDSLFMTSRDGQNFLRNEEAFLRPGPERSGVWTYGSTYMSYGFAETRNAVTGDEEISLYATENYRYGPTALRRYTLRQDGFRSWSSPWKESRVLTKPVKLRADGLSLNFSTSAQGYVRLRICDTEGTPVPGFDSGCLFGDALRRAVPFEGDPGSFADTPVRLEFRMSDADLYSMTSQDTVPRYMR
jgi:hypothetical protein